jgi:hypothetical protein
LLIAFPELEPSQDTPCDILHVVLLGFIKYFWCSAVSRQNAEEKQLLIVRINSLDVYALGLLPVRGKTLITYAGSLTGRCGSTSRPCIFFDFGPHFRTLYQ